MLNLTERAGMQNSTADEREPEFSNKPETSLQAPQGWQVPACHPVVPCRGAAAAGDLSGLKLLANAPVRSGRTRTAKSGHILQGIRLTGFAG